MTRQEIAAIIIEDLRRGPLEAQGLQRCEHEHDFHALVSDIIDDLEILAAKYRGLLQALYAAPGEPELTSVASNQTSDRDQGEGE